MDAFFFLGMKHRCLTITLAQACGELGITVGTAHNKICAGDFPIPTRIEGRNRVIDIRDLAEYLDRCRENAARKHNQAA